MNINKLHRISDDEIIARLYFSVMGHFCTHGDIKIDYMPILRDWGTTAERFLDTLPDNESRENFMRSCKNFMREDKEED